MTSQQATTSYCQIAGALNNMGVSMMLRGEFDCASSTLRDALSIVRMVLAASTTNTATTETTTTDTGPRIDINTGDFATPNQTATSSCASIGTEESIRFLDSFAKEKFQLASSRLSRMSTLSSDSRRFQQQHVLQGLLLTIENNDFQSLQEAAVASAALSVAIARSSSSIGTSPPLYAILIREHGPSSSSYLIIDEPDIDRESGIIMYNYGLACYLQTVFMTDPTHSQQHQQMPKQWQDHNNNRSIISGVFDSYWALAYRSLSMAQCIFSKRLVRPSSSSSSNRRHSHENNLNNDGSTQSRSEQTTFPGYEEGGNTSFNSGWDDDHHADDVFVEAETIFLSILVLSCTSRVLRARHDIGKALQAEQALDNMVQYLQHESGLGQIIMIALSLSTTQASPPSRQSAAAA